MARNLAELEKQGEEIVDENETLHTDDLLELWDYAKNVGVCDSLARAYHIGVALGYKQAQAEAKA